MSPFNPDIVIHKFVTKSGSRPHSSESTTSIFDAEDWRQMRKIMEEVINDIYARKAKKIQNTMYTLATENILIKKRYKGLEKTLINIQKRTNKKKPLLLDIASENNGGTIFWSPKKIQRARDLQH